jgi:hypothetical protein
VFVVEYDAYSSVVERVEDNGRVLIVLVLDAE